MAFENLHVYQAAQELRREVDKLTTGVDRRFANRIAHLDEALDSIENNIAEGSESHYPGKRASFYDIADGSVREVRSCIRSLVDRGAFSAKAAARAIALTFTISKMLRRLIERCGAPN